MYLFGEDKLRQSVGKEVQFETVIKAGDRGKSVKRIQEWLGLQNLGVVIDGVFGPVTSRTIQAFQRREGLQEVGVVDEATFNMLVAPMRETLLNPLIMSVPFGDAVSAFAHSHLAQHPREIGGDNRGPWVRLYMDGRDGSSQLWCAGFVRFCIRQAAESLNMSKPIAGSVSCDTLARQGKEAGLFLSEQAAQPHLISPGSIFLNRKTSRDWTHTGLVIDAHEDFFVTIEGNTNDDGSRNGYEVCSRRRSYRKRDFIVFN